MSKRFCVLQVTPSEPNPSHVELFADRPESDFYFVTHDSPNPEALRYCPNTVWSETRNILVEEVPKKYDYYGFVDHDYIIQSKTELNPAEQILDDLTWNPAILTYYPGKTLSTPYATDEEYFNSYDRSCIPFTHAGLKFVHKSLLNWFFPMYTKHRVDIDACHMFNIQEIPFLRHVVCSHKMIYDNGISGDATYNTNGRHAKSKMDEMWREASAKYKKMDSLKKASLNLSDSLSIKRFYVTMFKNSTLHKKNTKNPADINFLDQENISEFFVLFLWIVTGKRLNLN